MKNKKALLAVLLVLLAGALLYSYMASPRQVRVQRTDGSKPLVAEKSPWHGKRLNVELLKKETEDFPGVKRDLFRIKVKEAESIAEKREPEPPPVEVEPSTLPPPPIGVQFTYLGSLLKGEEKVLFLEGGGEVYVVSRAEPFGPGGQYRIEGIKDDYVRVLKKGSSRPQLVSLEERPSSAVPPQPSPSVEPGREVVPPTAPPLSNLPPGLRLPRRR